MAAIPAASGETVWWLPRQDGEDDAHGNPAYTWPAHTDDAAVEIDGAVVSPRSASGTHLSAETSEVGREAIIVGLMLFLPAGSPAPEPVDRMHVRGEDYDVVGEPGVWKNPWSGRERGVQVALERTEG